MLSFKKIYIPSFAPRRIRKKYKVRKLTLFVVTYVALSTTLAAFYIYSIPETQAKYEKKTLGVKTSIRSTKKSANITEYKIPTATPILPTATPTIIPPTLSPTPTIQVNEKDTTKTIDNVENDSSMAGGTDIFDALNRYRGESGIPSLSWDNTLADFANSRVNTFASINALDGHAGFRNYMDNNGFEISGFNGLGENSAQLAGPMQGDKIIRDIFGQSEAHNSSQLDASWTHVGISVNGIFVNVNFGKNKR